MRIPPILPVWPWLATAGVLLLCLSPCAAAQAQKPAPAPFESPAKPQKPAATVAQPPAEQPPTAGPKGAPSPDAIPEDEDFLKGREEWFLGDRTLPDGSVATGMRQRALKHVDRMIETQRRMGWLPLESAAPLATDFPGPSASTSIGPQPINVAPGVFPFNGSPSNSGRVAALAVDPRNPDVAFLGAAAGGVWKTIDAGLNWTPMTDNQPSLSIGSLAIDPTNSSIIYVGTGEQNFSGDSYSGAGVLKSTDGGATWTQQGANVFLGPGGGSFSSSRLDGGAHIGAIVVDPLSPVGQHIALAGVFRFSSPALSGIYRTTDGGNSWTGPVAGMSGAAGTAIVFHPTSSGVVYAALSASGDPTLAGVYRSTDHGATWTRMIGTAANPFPTTNVGRIDIDLARSTPNTLFALVAKADGTGLLGLWKTTNASNGANADWIQQINTPDFCTSTGGSQCFYDLTIRVSPNNANLLFAGGSSGDSQAVPFNYRALFRSTNGGANWSTVANGATSSLHVDLHALAFSSNGNRLYIGNDGGVWRSDSPAGRAIDYTNLNATLAITMSYPGHGVHFSDENIMFVGTQDNGTQRYSGAPAWDTVTGGDGTYAAIDPSVPSTVYTTCQFICIFRSITDGTTPASFAFKTNGINPSDRANFVAPLIHDPNIANRIYFGTFRVWLSTDAGENWTAISPDLTTGTSRTITSIAVARSDSNVVYVGTTAGSASGSRMSKTTNALAGTGSNWTDLTTPALPSGRTVTAVAVDAHDPNVAYATYSAFSGFGDTLGHVFRTTDGGTTWQDISGTGANALPNVPVNDILLDDAIPAAYVATDVGVFRTADASLGTNTVWTPVPGLPRVVVLSLNARGRSRIVRASTSGRGTWILQDNNVAIPAGPFLSSIRPTSAPADSTAVTLTNIGGAHFTPSSQVQWDGVVNGITTNFVDANHLTAVIPDSLLTAANVGVHQITVVDGASTSDFLRFSVLGAAPTITSLAPNSANAGGPGFNLQVNGTGFNCSTTPGAGSTLSFRGVPHTPLASPPCSPTQMTVAIAASEIAAGGNSNVTAFSPPPAGGSSNPPSSFSITAAPPVNDNFAQAIDASPVPFSDTEDNSGATTENGEPPTGCTAGQSPSTKSIWYEFIAAASGTVTANTNGTAYDSVLQAMTGTLGNFTSAACANLNGPGVGETVSFTAVAGTTYFFMISDFNGVGGATVFHLTGPTVIFNPASLAFGSVAVGSASAVSNVQLSNGGTGPLTFTSIALTGTNPAEFAVAVPTVGTDCRTQTTLAAGANCNVGLKFQPASTGAKSASLSVADDAAGSPQSVSLAGTGIAPAVTLVPTNLAFGTQRVSTPSPVQTVTLTNSGTAPLSIATAVPRGANAGDFALASGTTCLSGASLSAGANCVLSLTFPPTAASARTATVTIADDAADSPQSVSLAGTGIAPAVTLAPANLTFGTQRVSTPSPVQTVTLTNSGTAPLGIATAVLGGTNAGDFALASGTTCINGATLAACANCVLTLTFTPTAASARTATVTITDDAAGSPQSVSLTGTGVAPAVTLAPANLTFGTQRVSTPSPVQTVTLTNSGTAPLSIATAVLGGANAGDFALASGTTCINGATLAAGANCVLTLTFTPTAASARTATVTITDDAAGSPQSVSLTGTGDAPDCHALRH